jgi:hypothetical protein
MKSAVLPWELCSTPSDRIVLPSHRAHGSRAAPPEDAGDASFVLKLSPNVSHIE